MVRTAELRVSMTWPQFLRDECTVAGERVSLGPVLSRLLLALMVAKPHHRLTIPDLIERVWDSEREPKSADECIRSGLIKLRRKRIMIENFGYGRGYYLPAHRRAPSRPDCLRPGRCMARTEHQCTSCVNAANGRRNRLSIKQGRMLHLLRNNPPMTQPEMQRALGYRSKSSVQQMLERLERKGLIKTGHSKHRSTRLVLRSPAG